MATYYVRPTNGNDYSGTSFTDGSYVDSTRTLTKTGAGTGLTAGMRVRVSDNGSGKVVDGLYDVASATADTIVFVADITSSNQDCTDVVVSQAAGTSFGAAWATTQKAADNATSGEEVRLCAEATEYPVQVIDIDTNSGVLYSPIRFIGADGVDGTPLTTGHYTLDGTNLPATTSLVQIAQNYQYFDFYHIRFTAATARGMDIGAGGGWALFSHFVNCRFDNNASTGLGTVSSRLSTFTWCAGCEFDNNGLHGFGYNNTNNTAGNHWFYGCSFHNNTTDGMYTRNGTYVFYCEFYRNGRHGIYSRGSYCTAMNSVFYLQTSDGISTNALGYQSTVNCSFVSNGGWGIQELQASNFSHHHQDYNHFHNNTSGDNDYVSYMGANNQSGDPLFTSVADGSEDFTPTVGSPLITNGLWGVDIGSRKYTPAGGGGGTVDLPDPIIIGT